MKIAISLAVLAAVSVAYYVGGRYGGSCPQAVPSATEVFNLRSRCAVLGEKIMRENPSSPVVNPRVLSHFDPIKARCYVELDNEYSRRLFDGQTGERLAEIWNGSIPSVYLKGVDKPSSGTVRAFIDTHMAEDRK